MNPSSNAYQHVNSKGVTYFLNAKNVTLRGGHERVIYYFSKDERADTASALPGGMKVIENPRNGFLTLKKEA